MKGLTVIAMLIIGLVIGLLVGAYGLGGGASEGGGTEATADTPLAKPMKWKMAASFGSQWPIQGELGTRLVERVKAASDGTMAIEYFEPGALVPALEIFDSVSSGAIDAGWTSAGYWAGKVPALQFYTAVPFGPDAMEFAAWLYYGGGTELYEEIYQKFNIKALHCGVHSPEGSGWFREPIESLEDLRGLKMRFFGLGARVMEKLGVSTQLLAGGDIYPALELGTIDAAEYSMPIIDLDQGFFQITKHYYFPGWHQPSSVFELLINGDRWNELSESQQVIIQIVCGDNYREGLAKSEAAQAEALQALKGHGVQFHQWSPEILDALRAAWQEVAEEEAAKNEMFRRVWESFNAFREKYAVWAALGYVR